MPSTESASHGQVVCRWSRGPCGHEHRRSRRRVGQLRRRARRRRGRAGRAAPRQPATSYVVSTSPRSCPGGSARCSGGSTSPSCACCRAAGAPRCAASSATAGRSARCQRLLGLLGARLVREVAGAAAGGVDPPVRQPGARSRPGPAAACVRPVVTYLTDASVHRLWVHPAVDLHLAIHELTAQQARALGGAATASAHRWWLDLPPPVATDWLAAVAGRPARRPRGRWLLRGRRPLRQRRSTSSPPAW